MRKPPRLLKSTKTHDVFGACGNVLFALIALSLGWVVFILFYNIVAGIVLYWNAMDLVDD